MRFTQVLFLASTLSGALAGSNCKCQDPSGTGPQWNALTDECCNTDVNDGCIIPGPRFPGPNNQCVGANNCLNSGAFDNCCKSKGAPGAYCWK